MKALPQRLRASFLASVNDPEILSVRSELGLVDSRVVELIERITSGESVDVIKQARDLARSILVEVQKKQPNIPHIADEAGNLDVLLTGRIDDDANWATIRDTIESRRKLTDTERKLLEMRQAVVDSKQLQAIIAMLLTSITLHVLPLQGGRVAVDGVSEDIRKLMALN